MIGVKMKWHQLTESVDENNLEEFIQKNCQQYIRENPDWKIDPLYRGIQTNSEIQILSVRKDRRPMDSSEFYHNLFNKAFEANGIAANRSNSIFCSGWAKIAKRYGKVNVVLPIGEFKYAWSPTISDLYSYTDAIAADGMLRVINGDEDVLTINDIPPRILHHIDDDDFPEKFSYDFLSDRIDDSAADLHWLFDTHNNNIDTLLTKLDLDYNHFNKEFGRRYKTTDLPEAIHSGHEITIACNSYLAVPETLFANIYF